MNSRSDRLVIRLLPSATGGTDELQYSTSYLLNGSIAIDAGSIGFWQSPREQAQVRHVLLTHSHADHIASLPVLVENTLRTSSRPLQVWAGAEVLDCLERDVFNDRVWPRLEVLEGGRGKAVELHEIRSEEPLELEGLTVTPVAVDHSVPAFGFLIAGGGASVVVSGDTGPTQRLWELARSRQDLAGVFLEVAFPEEQAELARVSCHLTPRTFEREWQKIGRDVPLVAVHLKPRYREALLAELEALSIRRLEIGSPHKEYRF